MDPRDRNIRKQHGHPWSAAQWGAGKGRSQHELRKNEAKRAGFTVIIIIAINDYTLSPMLGVWCILLHSTLVMPFGGQPEV